MSLSDEELADEYPRISVLEATELYAAVLVSMSWGHHERCAAVKGDPGIDILSVAKQHERELECDCGYAMMRAAVKKARGE